MLYEVITGVAAPERNEQYLHQQSMQVFQARTQAAGIDLTSVQFAALDAIAEQPGTDQASLSAAIGFV